MVSLCLRNSTETSYTILEQQVSVRFREAGKNTAPQPQRKLFLRGSAFSYRILGFFLLQKRDPAGTLFVLSFSADRGDQHHKGEHQ